MACFKTIKERFKLSNTTFKLKLLVNWRGLIAHRIAYMTFWGKSVLASICIESSHFGVELEPANCVALLKVCHLFLYLANNEIQLKDQ
jgi:hypothetical protein